MDSHAWSQLLPSWVSGKESTCQCRRRGLDTWVLGTRLLCPRNSPGRNTGVGSPLPSSGDLPNSGTEPVWATREAHIIVLPKSRVCLTKSRRMAWCYLLTWGSHSSVPKIGTRIQLCKLRPDPWCLSTFQSLGTMAGKAYLTPILLNPVLFARKLSHWFHPSPRCPVSSDLVCVLLGQLDFSSIH